MGPDASLSKLAAAVAIVILMALAVIFPPR
jgi:hypothetical protein